MTLNNQLKLSQMVLSCLNFGTKTDKKRAFDLLDEFLEQGRTFLDTSNNYSFGFDDSRGGVSMAHRKKPTRSSTPWDKKRILRELDKIGINKKTLFQDHDSVAAYLIDKYTQNKIT